MRLSPATLEQFASQARRSLETLELPRRKVLLSRIQQQQIRPYLQVRSLSTNSVASTPSVSASSFPISITKSPQKIRPNETRSETKQTQKQDPTKTDLPISCPGCGALSQSEEPEGAGYYTRTRKPVRAYLNRHLDQYIHKKELATVSDGAAGHTVEDATTEQSNADLQPENLQNGSIEAESLIQVADTTAVPICDRCHYLLHDSRGVSIAHPSIQDIEDSIAESPFSRNHIYHVLDAVDFPMSLVKSVHTQLTLAKVRSQNRRSQHSFSSKPTLSFLITRSDLLGPTKESVDAMMPYFQSVLRKALGRTGEKMRLGNVHLISAKRGWWTSDIKDQIWNRGGGNWMVGKFNVGKSNLFEVLFPKGSGDRAPVYADLLKPQAVQTESQEPTEPDLLPENSLLPPPQPETPFPTLPIVSRLPGTTASPIRLPFGNRKGELIDLPGLERGNLEQYVLPDHRRDLVMQARPRVEQLSIKPGQSLVLGGGLVRITPELDINDKSTTMLAYPFIPIDAYVTSTEKAIVMQAQERVSGLKSIMAEGISTAIRSAGTYALDHDVTKVKSGPLLRAGLDISKLPFNVWSTDILVEGIGWIELVCQTRKSRRLDSSGNTQPAISEPRDALDQTFNAFADQRTTHDPQQNVSPSESANEVVSSKQETSTSLNTETTIPEDPKTETGPNTQFVSPFYKPATYNRPASSLVTPKTSPDSITSPQNTDSFSPYTSTNAQANSSPFPMVHIFTPNGASIAQRQPLGAWARWQNAKDVRVRERVKMGLDSGKKHVRPKRSMKGVKKAEKLKKRAAENQA